MDTSKPLLLHSCDYIYARLNQYFLVTLINIDKIRRLGVEAENVLREARNCGSIRIQDWILDFCEFCNLLRSILHI